MFEILVQQTNDRNVGDAKMKVIYEIKEFWFTKHWSGCMYLDVSQNNNYLFSKSCCVYNALWPREHVVYASHMSL